MLLCRSLVVAAAGDRVRAAAHARLCEHRAPQPVHAPSGVRRVDPSRVRRLHLQLRRLDLLARRQHARCAARCRFTRTCPRTVAASLLRCATFRTDTDTVRWAPLDYSCTRTS